MKLRWFFSENLMLFLASTIVKKKLKKKTKWIKSIKNSTKILKRFYEILMHEIRIENVNSKKQNEAIEKLLKQNKMFHKNLNIIRMTWSRKMKRLKKAYFSLIVETKFSKKINRIITERFLKKKSRKNAIIFSRKCRIIQCFNCYEYNHIEKMCKNVKKCDHCAERHNTNRCNKGEIKITHKCINCEQTEHQAWTRICSVKRKEMKRFKKAYDICSVLYFTVFRNIIESIEQNNKMSTKNDVVSTNLRIQIQISQSSQQQQEATKEEKRTLINKTNEEKAMKKEIKTIKTLREYLINRSIIISKNKKMTKKFITKIDRNSKNVENEKKLWVLHSKLIYWYYSITSTTAEQKQWFRFSKTKKYKNTIFWQFRNHDEISSFSRRIIQAKINFI